MNQLTRPEYRAMLRPVVVVVSVALGFAVATGFAVAALTGAETSVAQRAHVEPNSGYINRTGYAEGWTQPRSLVTEDGRGIGSGHELARFEPSGNTTVRGAIHINGDCGEWTLDANTRSGWTFVPKSGSCE